MFKRFWLVALALLFMVGQASATCHFGGFLKQSTAVTVTVTMIDSSDHIAGKTGLSAGITKYLTKAGGTPASATMTTTELDSTNVKGGYSLAFTTSHTDTLGEFRLDLSGSGADPSCIRWQVTANIPGDGTITANQAVNAAQIGGQTATAAGAVTVGAYVGNATAALAVDANGRTQVQTGTSAGQLDATSGRVKADTVYWNAAAVATPATAGYPAVTHKVGTGTGELSITSGVVSANATQINGVATSSVTAVNANQGTTQPINFTGTSTSALVKGDTQDWAGTAVHTPATAGYPDVNVYNYANTLQTTTPGSVSDVAAAILKTPANLINTDSSGNAYVSVGTGTGQINLSSGAVPVTGDLTSTMKTSVENTVWNAVGSSHTTSGTMGQELNSAGTAADPWSTALPGAYGAGTAGNILGSGVKVSVGTGTGQINLSSGAVPVTGDLTSTMKSSVTTAASSSTPTVTISTGTGAGQINLSSGKVPATLSMSDVSGALSELSQAQPSATPTLQQAIMALYMCLRNGVTVTGSSKACYNDAGTLIFKWSLSDDGTTFTQQKAVTGP